jgi:hypothetical protein
VLADRKAITTGSAPSAYATTHTSKLITAWARTSRSSRKSIDTPHPRYAFPRRALIITHILAIYFNQIEKQAKLDTQYFKGSYS